LKLHIAILFVAGWAGTCCAEDEKPVYRDAATHEQLAQRLQMARQRDPMRNRQAVAGEDPSKVHRPQNLLDQSDIITFGGLSTIVPKRAILSTPANYKRYLTREPGARFVPWAEFYRKNRGWISTIEVSRVQAEGKESLSEEVLKRLEESSNLLVATHLGGPISVLPLQETDADSAESQPAKP
jgi:hypothetical protein